jgi:hypothetical protein
MGFFNEEKKKMIFFFRKKYKGSLSPLIDLAREFQVP